MLDAVVVDDAARAAAGTAGGGADAGGAAIVAHGALLDLVDALHDLQPRGADRHVEDADVAVYAVVAGEAVARIDGDLQIAVAQVEANEEHGIAILRDGSGIVGAKHVLLHGFASG